jgi:hypothetical protein
MAGGDVDVAVCSSACTHVPDELAQHAGECDALRACAPWLEECFDNEMCEAPADSCWVLERALRVIPLGRKNWLFCWTEVGAKYVGIFQSLIITCKMHGIDPHTYLVDVLQRVTDHLWLLKNPSAVKSWCFSDQH